MKARYLIGFLLATACADSDGAASTSAATTTDADTGSCEPGSPGCACANGMCLDPLVCLLDECVWPPPPDDGGNDESSSGADESTGSEPEPCSSNDECGGSYVCNTDGTCVFARDASYEIRVPNWDPGVGCDDGIFSGDADLYWNLTLGGVDWGGSGWVQGGCPGSWPNDTVCVPATNLYDGWYLEARDEDGDYDPPADTLWWDDDLDSVPDPISVSILHDGVYTAGTGSGGTLRVELTVVEACF